MATTAAPHPTETKKEVISTSTDQPAAKRARSDNFPLNSEFLKFLCINRAESLKPEGGVLYVASRDDKVADVYKGLIKHGFSSVPVLQKTKNMWYGFIDLADIVHAIVEAFGFNKLLTEKEFWDAVDKDEKFQKQLVKNIMTYPLSRRNPFHPVMKGFSLFSVIELLAKEPSLHRVPVIDAERKLFTIVTQSQVANFLSTNINLLGAMKNKPIHMLPSANTTVVRINEKEHAIEAFKTMHFMNVSGLAVVNDENKLVNAISLSDLKIIRHDGGSFTRLSQSVKNFLAKSAQEGFTRPSNPVVIEANDTIETAMRKFQEFHVHRLFVVDDKMQPIGIVSLKDILLEIISE